jgi:SAM-dependent methyltransferase
MADMTCHLCSATLTSAPIVGETSRHGHPARRVACSSCGLVQRSPQPDPRELAEYYRTKYRTEYTPLPAIYNGEPIKPSDPRFEAVLRIGAADYASWIANHSSGREVLEIGSGEGRLTAALCQRGYQVTAIEPDDACAKRIEALWGDANRPTSPRILNGIWEWALPQLAGSQFGAVVMQHSLEHMPDPIGMLRDIRKLMRPTGALLIEVPDVLDPYGPLGGWYWQHVHLYDFSADTLTRSLAAAGFRVRELAHDHHALMVVAEPSRAAVKVSTEVQCGEWIAGYLARYSAEGERDAAE